MAERGLEERAACVSTIHYTLMRACRCASVHVMLLSTPLPGPTTCQAPCLCHQPVQPLLQPMLRCHPHTAAALAWPYTLCAIMRQRNGSLQQVRKHAPIGYKPGTRLRCASAYRRYACTLLCFARQHQWQGQGVIKTAPPPSRAWLLPHSQPRPPVTALAHGALARCPEAPPYHCLHASLHPTHRPLPPSHPGPTP